MVHRFIDFPHPPASNGANDLESTGKDLSTFESPRLDQPLSDTLWGEGLAKKGPGSFNSVMIFQEPFDFAANVRLDALEASQPVWRIGIRQIGE
jgi:hypothetical protein